MLLSCCLCERKYCSRTLYYFLIIVKSLQLRRRRQIAESRKYCLVRVIVFFGVCFSIFFVSHRLGIRINSLHSPLSKSTGCQKKFTHQTTEYSHGIPKEIHPSHTTKERESKTLREAEEELKKESERERTQEMQRRLFFFFFYIYFTFI